jgi:hypothetical protein
MAATLCVELVRNRRPVQEVREVASVLVDVSRRVPHASPHGSLWRSVQTAVADLGRELGVAGSSPTAKPIIGRVSWRGVVDDRVQLFIRGSTVESRTVSGATSAEGVSSFTSSLPAAVVSVDVTKVAGRGIVTVLQQPARTNDFTAVIEIYDDRPGAQEYRLDIVWR